MHPSTLADYTRRTSSSTRACPLNSGLAIVDQLLAAVVRAKDTDGLDAALDFRLLLAGPHQPDEILHGFFRLRSLIEDQHFLACFRLRRWLESQIAVQVQVDRWQPPRLIDLRLDCLNYATLCDRCARAASAGDVAAAPRVRFVTAAPVN